MLNKGHCIMDNKKALALEDLKKIAGGSDAEWAELKQIVMNNPKLKAMYDKYLSDPYFEDDADRISEILYDIWDICVGWSDGDPNVYDYGDYTHEQIKEMLRNYK